MFKTVALKYDKNKCEWISREVYVIGFIMWATNGTINSIAVSRHGINIVSYDNVTNYWYI